MWGGPGGGEGGVAVGVSVAKILPYPRLTVSLLYYGLAQITVGGPDIPAAPHEDNGGDDI